jgi:outer membrane translocation and assembly module TamA
VEIEAVGITGLGWGLMKTTIRVGCTLVVCLVLGLLLTPMEVLSSPPGERQGVDARAAVPDQPDRVAGDPETQAPVVRRVRWEGNQTLGRRELAAVAFTRGRSWRLWRSAPEFSEPTLVGDMDRITSLYQLHGFYQTSARYSLAWNRDQTAVSVTIHVDEGPAVVLTELQIQLPAEVDLPPAERDRLLVGLSLAVGERFSAKRYAETKQQLLARLADAAHPLTRIEGGATVDLERHEAVVEWRIDPGPTVLFGPISIRGLYRVDEKTARREVHIRTGQRYSTRALAQTRRDLQRQGLYRWVGVKSESQRQPATDEGPPVPPASGDTAALRTPEVIWPVEIRVTERSPYTVDVGVGYSTDESYRVTAGWRHGNFFGDARKLRLTGLYSGILSKLETELIQPYFFDSKLSVITRASVRRETEPAFDADRFLTSIGLSRPLWRPWRGRITYEFSWQDVVKTTEDVTEELDEPVGVSRTATIELGLRRQTIDDLLNARQGTWLDFVVAPSLEEIGSDFDYVGFLVEARGFLPSVWGSVLAGRILIGSIQPVRGTRADQVPVVSRFFAGGSTSHRGFSYHRMPSNEDTDANVGGTSLLETSAEWRFPLWRKLSGVVFVDAGLLDLEPWHYRLRDLFWATGSGLRYDTIVGPLRFDYGVLLNPPDGTSRHQWFISVGHSF